MSEVEKDRDKELAVILSDLKKWKKKYKVPSIHVTIGGDNLAYSHGWDGYQQINVNLLEG